MKKQTILLFVLLIACVVLMTPAVRAQRSEGITADEPVTAAVEHSSVEWRSRLEYVSATLVVAGPGEFWMEKAFPSGVPIVLSVDDGPGASLPDGQYTYELTLQPALTTEEQAMLQDVAETDQREEAVAALRQTGALSAGSIISRGTFRVSDGRIVVGTEAEPNADAPNDRDPGGNAPLDVLHYDDVIVTGSLCTGFDCADGESFGFDAIKLKEHNLRILFDDTSYTASYPTNDWRIVINDSTNGGAAYFGIEDVTDGTMPFRIEAGAPTSSLYVEDYGRVGLGTSTPVVELHIKDSDTPTMRLEQDSSGGWTAQTWDVAGNESNFFVRDATNGSKLPFRIEPNSPSSSLNIRSSGNIGFGTWSPEYPMELETTGEDAVFVAQRTDGAMATVAALGDAVQLGSVSDHNVAFVVNGVPVMHLDASGNLTIEGALTEASDVGRKENFTVVGGDEILRKIGELTISTWNYQADEDAIRHMGPMAQDFYRLFGLGSDQEHIAPLDANGVALVGIQELYQLAQAQQARIEQLEADNQALEGRLDALEAMMDQLLAAQGGEHD